MIVIPGRIPIIIHPFFWILAALIGWMGSQNWMGTLIWVGIIFVSVLFHEYGHALTSIVFKQKASIQLVALGGVTSYEGPKLSYWKQFLIVFNGPLFGFFLFLIATALLQLNLATWPTLQAILKWMQTANLFWTAVNLLPILPLDGGQLLRIVLEGFFGMKGLRASLLIGTLLATFAAIGFFLIGALLAGSLFFLFAFQSFDSWRKTRYAGRSDRDEEIKQLLKEGEEAFQLGKKEEAKRLFEELKRKSSAGILSAAAGQYLALIAFQEGERQKAYAMLLELQPFLADDTRCLLHQLAAEFGNDVLVAALSAECYQLASTQEVALRNARSFAKLRQPRLAGGWLQTALSYGGLNLETVLAEPSFQAICQDPEFRSFVEKLP